MEVANKGRVVFGDDERPGFWDSPAAHKDSRSFVFVSARDNSDDSEMSRFEQRMDLFRRSSSLFTLDEWESVTKFDASELSSPKQLEDVNRNRQATSGELNVHHHEEESKATPRYCETNEASSNLEECDSNHLETSDDWTDIDVPPEEKRIVTSTPSCGDFEVLKRSCHIMSQLEVKGVHYEPLKTTYALEVVDEVEAKGDCMFLAIAKLMQNSVDQRNPSEAVGPGVHADSSQLRQTAADRFFLQYHASSGADKVKIDATVKHFYFPDISKGWSIHRTQSRKFIAEKKNRWKINHKIKELMSAGMSWMDAAEVVYSDELFASPVTNTEIYNEYIRIGGFQRAGEKCRAFNCDYYIVTIDYTISGVLAVDDDPEELRIAWGDDFMLEALSAIFARDIFVVLVGDDDALFLQYKAKLNKKRKRAGRGENEGVALPAPWFLQMMANGSHGGDHYSPMQSTPLKRESHMCPEHAYAIVGQPS